MDENAQIAAQLREAAALLQAQEGNPFRVGAYRKAADGVARAERPVRELFDQKGRAGLESLPGVGPGIAGAIAEMLVTGRWAQLARLRGDADLEALFCAVPASARRARAHELGRTRDWVVIYYYDREHVEAQCTVVTEARGALAGKRVVRGREDECRAHYELLAQGAHA